LRPAQGQNQHWQGYSGDAGECRTEKAYRQGTCAPGAKVLVTLKIGRYPCSVGQVFGLINGG
jgi:hypothetical protein